MAQKEDTARWTRTKQGWSLIVTFRRYWEAPKVGEGRGTVLTVPVYRKGDYRGVDTDVKLTSGVFRAKDGSRRSLKKWTQRVRRLGALLLARHDLRNHSPDGFSWHG